MGACIIAGTWAAEYGCEKQILENLCPPGSTITKTIRDTLEKHKTVVVTIPCNTIQIMICGTEGIGAGALLRRMCAGIL